MSRYYGDEIKEIKTNKNGKDEKGEYEIVNVVGEEYCNCHPETCCHFDGKRSVNYEKKVYK